MVILFGKYFALFIFPSLLSSYVNIDIATAPSCVFFPNDLNVIFFLLFGFGEKCFIKQQRSRKTRFPKMVLIKSHSLIILFLVSGFHMSDFASPGQLLDIFSDIYDATDTFPDHRDEYTQLAIVNRHQNACLAIMGRKVGNGGRIGLDECYFTHVDSPELFHVKHVGGGFVTLATPWNQCIGGGKRDGAAVWTGDWCDSYSHHFSMVVRDTALFFLNRESGTYLTAVQPKKPVQLRHYNSEDLKQIWSICDPSGKKCWPKSITEEEVAVETKGNETDWKLTE